jgi:peptidoglycan hydrolase-like protein with peptidoglycan-binding domain
MPLQSRLFAEDRRLQRCAVEHAAHVQPGDRGDFVERIQRALRRLDAAQIAPNELAGAFYGPSTAQAVLAYKTKRRIINTSYQTKPDAIVGIMTIGRMDQELRGRDLLPRQPGVCQLCGVSADRLAPRGHAIRPTVAKPVAEPDRKKQLGGMVRIFLQQTSHSIEKGHAFPFRRQVEVAKDRLFEHGVSFSVESGLDRPQTIKFSDAVVTDDDVADLHRASQLALPTANKMIRVIICSMRNSTHFGETHTKATVDGAIVPPFVLLNSALIDRDNATLLHELIHASKKIHPHSHDPEPHSIFSRFGHDQSSNDGDVERRMLKAEHAETLARSFFAL